MPQLILIRHSITQPVRGVPSHEWALTDEGKARCLALAEQVKPYRVAHIATSDEPKAVATARLLARHLGIDAPLTIESNFRETRREHAPYYEDQTDFRAAIREAMLSPNHTVFGEESFTEARVRFTNALFRLLSEHSGHTLAVVTHGTIMSLLLGHACGVDTFSTWDSLDMPAYAVLTPNLDLLDLKYSVG